MQEATPEQGSGAVEEIAPLSASETNSISSSRADVVALKKSLLEAIGVNAAKYWEVLKRYTQHRLTKVELDKQVPELIGTHNIQRHNEFILALLKNAYGDERPEGVKLKPRPEKLRPELKLPAYFFASAETSPPPLFDHSNSDGSMLRPQRKRSQRLPGGGREAFPGDPEGALSPSSDDFLAQPSTDVAAVAMSPAGERNCFSEL
ncbi:hypothetical protein CYMTET_21272 [Cymbomonas tetramitiformis]|uniref:Uncharacterized protein n=1 Tax=Cymbomonas tetramitiformis TaxID=36881 RepID=A0AAE0G2I2_9CHLO|nr:hypothetical protein CYMTET_21272 [Cymbomonas tetramitiformis]